MSPRPIDRDEVIERSRGLASFPRVVAEILATVDDAEASTEMLVGHIERDPVITARVLSLANMAATRTRGPAAIHDLFTATSLIGMNHVRELAILSGVGGFIDDFAPAGVAATFWPHSVAVGVCSEELALHTTSRASAAIALIAGLLHDVGQLWLYRFDPETFGAAWCRALGDNVGIEQAECERFGVDHTTVGGWLAEHWSLPANIAAAIRHHHAPDAALSEPLVPLVHVAEVLANALALTGREENRVIDISKAACRALDLNWSEAVRPLFGRMEARSRHVNAFFTVGAHSG